jgi:hypothetical protein
MSRKREEYWQSIQEQRQVMAFLKDLLKEKSWRITQLEQKPAKNDDGDCYLGATI